LDGPSNDDFRNSRNVPDERNRDRGDWVANDGGGGRDKMTREPPPPTLARSVKPVELTVLTRVTDGRFRKS